MDCRFDFPADTVGILQCQEKGHESHRLHLYADPEGRVSTLRNLYELGRLTGEALAEVEGSA